MNITEVALKIMSEHKVCDSCLGRLFSMLGKNVDNYSKGKAIKTFICISAHRNLLKDMYKDGVKILETIARNGGFKLAYDVLKGLNTSINEEEFICELCGGLIDKIDEYIQSAIDKLKNIEYNTFIVGVTIPSELVSKEDTIRSKFKLPYVEALKKELNRRIGLKIALLTGKRVEFKTPDVLIHIDFVRKSVNIKTRSIFIFGRYLKFKREIPQNIWICGNCNGLGCTQCNWTGRKYQVSIEELIGEPISKMFNAKKWKFHGAGREDVDARVLGRGRPFVIEVIEPKKRNIELESIAKVVNDLNKELVKIQDLAYVSKSLVKDLKIRAKIAKKTYNVKIKVDGGISEEELKHLVEAFKNVTVEQRTPIRVLRRRADKIRRKRIYSVNAKIISNDVFEAIITCQGGLYIKEVVSGDGGRTKPSFTEILNKKATCLELDVIDVE